MSGDHNKLLPSPYLWYCRGHGHANARTCKLNVVSLTLFICSAYPSAQYEWRGVRSPTRHCHYPRQRVVEAHMRAHSPSRRPVCGAQIQNILDTRAANGDQSRFHRIWQHRTTSQYHHSVRVMSAKRSCSFERIYVTCGCFLSLTTACAEQDSSRVPQQVV